MKGCANAAISILQKAVDASQESDAYYMNGRLTSAAKLQLLADKYTSATQLTGIAANGKINKVP